MRKGKNPFAIWWLSAVLLLFSVPVSHSQDDSSLSPQFVPVSRIALPLAPKAPVDNPTTSEKVALGRFLFWDPLLSGNKDVACASCHHPRFDGLFGGRRNDLAPTGIYAVLGRGNLSTPALRLEARPNKRLDWFLNYRLLWLASATDAFSATGVRDGSGESGRFAGQQIEGRLRYWLVPDALQFELDAALLLKGRFLKEAPNAPATADTVYTSLNMTVFF